MRACFIASGLVAVALVAGLAGPSAVRAEPPGEAASVSRQVKSWIRAKLVRESDLRSYGLKLESRWHPTAAQDELVLFIHGFNGEREDTADFLAEVKRAGRPCGTFVYPNDHALDASARLLSHDLKRFAARNPNRRVAIVAQSMGGLVVRACIEDPHLDPGNVRRLVMIAPPNHGSRLAHFGFGTDLCEHFLWDDGRGPIARLRGSIADGMAEAVEDLCPGSTFLEKLNARPRNPRVRYSIILGTGSGVTPEQLESVRRNVRRGLEPIPLLGRNADDVDTFLADMDEIVAGRGDGVVAVKRGKLAGVEDTLLLDFCHLALTGSYPNEAEMEKLKAAVLARLAD